MRFFTAYIKSTEGGWVHGGCLEGENYTQNLWSGNFPRTNVIKREQNQRTHYYYIRSNEWGSISKKRRKLYKNLLKKYAKSGCATLRCLYYRFAFGHKFGSFFAFRLTYKRHYSQLKAINIVMNCNTSNFSLTSNFSSHNVISTVRNRLKNACLQCIHFSRQYYC